MYDIYRYTQYKIEQIPFKYINTRHDTFPVSFAKSQAWLKGSRPERSMLTLRCSWMKDFGPIMVDSQVLRQFQGRNSTDFLVGTIFFSTRTCCSLPPAGGKWSTSSFRPAGVLWVVGCLGGDFGLQLERFQSLGNWGEMADRSMRALKEKWRASFVFFLTDLRLEEFHVFFSHHFCCVMINDRIDCNCWPNSQYLSYIFLRLRLAQTCWMI